MYKLELTEQEISVLRQLLDIAVKSVGLQGAESALFFARKLQACMVVEEAKQEEKVNG